MGRTARHARRTAELALFLFAAAQVGGASPVAADAPTYDLSWSVTRAGTPITDGTIQIGDQFKITINSEPGNPLEACSFQIATGVNLIEGPGALVGPAGAEACRLTTIIPVPVPGHEDDHESRDFCVLVDFGLYANHVNHVMDPADRHTPGGLNCGRRWGSPDVLDFTFDGVSGSHRTFSSTPQLLSWDITDWDPDYQPLSFNTDWHVHFPDWLTDCEPSLNGSWQTTYFFRSPVAGDCPDWEVHLPGVLPALVPWQGGPGDWDMEIVLDHNQGGRTVAHESVPYAPSDGEFSSSWLSIAPTDLSTARFVAAGQRWRPEFRLSGGDVFNECYLVTFAGADHLYPGAYDSDTGLCTFDIASLESGFWSQYGVSGVFTAGGGGITYGGTITAIEPPTPPEIADPTSNPDGTTTVVAAPGDGQGMSLTIEASPEATQAGGVAGNAQPNATPACRGISYTASFESGGSLKNARKKCSLQPGRYVLTSRMVDAAGNRKTSRRTITISRPTDGSGAFAVAPAAVSAGAAGLELTFTYAAGPGGMTGGAVRFTVPSRWSAPSKSHAAAGYVVASKGTVSITDRTVIVSGLTRTAGQLVTVTYGSRAAGGPGANAPPKPGSAAWATSQKATSGGQFTRLAHSPTISIYAHDGSGAATIAPKSVRHSQRATLRLTYTVAAGGMNGGELRLTVPTGWSPPSRTRGSAGYVVASAGVVSISGRTISVSGLTRAAGQTVVVTYGSTTGGGPGARAPATIGAQKWPTRERSTAAGVARLLDRSPIVTVD